MTPIPINIAVEDLLSEAVVRRLLDDSSRPFAVGVSYNRGGYGYLRKTVLGWNNAAKGVPFFLLTDLDLSPCPSDLITSWVAGELHRNLIFRVAVREVESWLLADHANLAMFLGTTPSRLPARPDEVSDPKSLLIATASRYARTEIKARIVPRPGTTAKQGRDYNACLTEFVIGRWNPAEAALNSPSLDRCRKRLASFAPVWGT
jgi:hypothetical protein